MGWPRGLRRGSAALHVSDRFSVHHHEYNSVYTTIGICHKGLADCLLARYSWWWTENLSETCRVQFQK